MWSGEKCCRRGGNKDLSVSYLFFPFNQKYSGFAAPVIYMLGNELLLLQLSVRL